MSLSTYSKNNILDFTLGGAAFPSPSAVYVSAHLGDPGLTGVNEINDISETWYVRQSVSFDPPAGRAIISGAGISFPKKTTAGDLTATHYGFWDAATNGNFLGSGDPTDLLFTQNQQLIMQAGNITFTMNTGAITTAHVHEILDHIFRNTAMTDPGTIYIALFTANPSDSGSVTNEVVASVGYTREIGTFGPASSGAISINADIVFGPATGSWGTIIYVAACKGSTRAVADLLWYLPTDPDQLITSGLDLTIFSGNLTCTL